MIQTLPTIESANALLVEVEMARYMDAWGSNCDYEVQVVCIALEGEDLEIDKGYVVALSMDSDSPELLVSVTPLRKANNKHLRSALA